MLKIPLDVLPKNVGTTDLYNEHSVVFVFDETNLKRIKKPCALLVLPQSLTAPTLQKFMVSVDSVEAVFFEFMKELESTMQHSTSGIHPTAHIDDSATIEKNVSIGPYSTVGPKSVLKKGVRLGAGVHCHAEVTLEENGALEDGVVIYDRVSIGSQSRVMANTVIGSPGFGFLPNNGQWSLIPHLASVRIGVSVSIGSCVAIDAGKIDSTEIGDHVIIDNGVHIAHQVKIGAGSAIAGHVGIAGSTTVGRNCRIGGNASLGPKINLADGTTVTGHSVMVKSSHRAAVYSGVIPAMSMQKWRRCIKGLFQLVSEREK